jgi:hypothetical protein
MRPTQEVGMDRNTTNGVLGRGNATVAAVALALGTALAPALAALAAA